MLGGLALQVGLLGAQRLQIAARGTDRPIQLGELALTGPINVLDAGIQAQQLGIRGGLGLFRLQALTLCGGGRRWHHAHHSALVGQHLVALGDKLRRHTLTVEHNHALVVDIAIQLAGTRQGG